MLFLLHLKVIQNNFLEDNYQLQIAPKLQRIINECSNDEEAFNTAKKSAMKILESDDDFYISDMAMIGEDFSEYANLIPCVFVHLGTDAGYPLHNSHINFDEQAMKTGMALEVQFALDVLNN